MDFDHLYSKCIRMSSMDRKDDYGKKKTSETVVLSQTQKIVNVPYYHLAISLFQ